ncbi:MAG: phosphatase PAP2 family protein [Holosporales bacterium]|jgi:membrane-associated phospholipid phosphatase|nr:phosphatase PAP2 family protein [Holosporales bacterium]
MQDFGDDLRLIVPTWAFGMAIAEETWTGTRQFLYSLLSSQLVVEGLKKITQQERPNYSGSGDKDSFPSGHAAGAFTGATFIHVRYGLSHALVPYWLATFVACTRVESGRHYPRDVIIGAAISAFFTLLFVDEKSQIELSTRNDGIQVAYKIRT